MNTKYNDVINELVEVLQEAGKKESVPMDIQAKVIRVDNDVIWVHLPGGVDETPVRKTINAKQGDIVQVKISNGDAWITGNATAPPTDDTKAEAAHIYAGQADEKAKGAQLTADEEVEARSAIIREYDDGVLVAKPGNQYGALINAGGSFDVVALTWSGREPVIGNPVASFGSVAIIGGRNGRRIEINDGFVSIYDNNSNLVFRVGEGAVTDQETAEVMRSSRKIGENGVVTWEVSLIDTPTTAAAIELTLEVWFYTSLNQSQPFRLTDGTIFNFVYGTSSTVAEQITGKTITVDYDGNKTFTVTMTNAAAAWFGSTIRYNAAETTEPIVSIGRGTHAGRNGFSAGMYNIKDTNNAYCFIVGNGTDNSNRSNALTLTWDGILSVARQMRAKDVYATDGVWSDRVVTDDVEAHSDILVGGTINLAGSIKRKTYTWTISSIGANEYKSTEVDPPTESGYTPISIAGWGIDGTGTSHVKWVKCYINSSGKLVIGLMNDNSNARTNWTATVHILYVKS